MIVTVLSIAAILYLALQLEDKLKIPSPVGLISLSFGFHAVFGGAFMLTGDAEHFATLVILLLPILLIADSLELKVDDLKEHGLSLFMLAVVAVALSVVVALLIGDMLFGQYHLSVPAIIVLFAMVLATDPVSVVSIFSNFELPHRLKILCEGESLFNDATALIVFVFIGLYALEGGDITVGYVSEISAIVVLGSALLGVVIGYIGLIGMKSTENRTAELLVLILTGIFATVTVHHVMSKSIAYDDMRIEKESDDIHREADEQHSSRNLINQAIDKIKATVEERDRHMRTKEDIQLLSIVANTILFVAMAEIINLDLLWQYKKEILIMFLATTVIRAAMMAKFAILTNQTNKMTNVNFRWWGVLTFAGIKGGLSVVMLMMIPASFEHLEMFKAIVVGVVMLSTFIYSFILIVLIGSNKKIFAEELRQEGDHH